MAGTKAGARKAVKTRKAGGRKGTTARKTTVKARGKTARRKSA